MMVEDVMLDRGGTCKYHADYGECRARLALITTRKCCMIMKA